MKYITKNGSIVEHVRANQYKVLKGGHKCFSGRGGYSRGVNNKYEVTDTLGYDIPHFFARYKKEYEKYHGLDIVGTVLNFYEVACRMKKNKKAKFRLLGEDDIIFDYEEFNSSTCGHDINFVATSEWVKV
jgi:hypothetical protein